MNLRMAILALATYGLHSIHPTVKSMAEGMTFGA